MYINKNNYEKKKKFDIRISIYFFTVHRCVKMQFDDTKS